MANKQLIDDLKTIVKVRGLDRDWIRTVASRALEEIEYLQNEVDRLEMEAAGEDY